MKFDNSDTKVRFKMYKSGKNWITAGIVSTSLIALSTILMNTNTYSVNASANVNGSSELSEKKSETINSNGDQSKDKNTVDTNAEKNSPTTDGESGGSTSTESSNGSSVNPTSSSNDKSSVQPVKNTSAPVTLSTSINANASSSFKSHIKVSNGKIYYYDGSNNIVKNQVIEDNNSNYYFGSDGSLTTYNANFANGTVTSSDNTSAYSNDGKSIQNLDGFLTADTWYRPKKIYAGNNTWRDSTDNDYRPLLSVWWPSRSVEINYLNYMSSKGYAQGSYNENSSSDELSDAAKIVQENIENQIKKDNGSLDTIKNLFSEFINSQSQWNIKSEDLYTSSSLQGGTLKYNNSDQTQDTNSNYRLINRSPSQQDGKVNYHYATDNGYEFLLASDVDNSNPVVQAEDLNWLHYFMNFGTITQNDSKANFDGVRLDALDNVDADVVNIITDYFKDAYGIFKNDANANKHLSILEDWSKNDAYYQKDHGSAQLTMDVDYLNNLRNALVHGKNSRGDLSTLINSGLVNRSNDKSQNKSIPNYTFIRAHDYGVQDIIAWIVTSKINPKANSFNPTPSEIAKAFKIYNKDQDSTNKVYTMYNIPTAYSLLLTNKDTVPRIYYGDLYRDNGQFMANKTPYFDSITTMLKARIKYVSGGQSMKAFKVNNGKDTILTSVRYGKGAATSKSKGTKVTRKSGIAVVISNNPNLKLKNSDKIVINMGAAHKNQKYRALISPTKKGLATYLKYSKSDRIIKTDSKGRLVLTGSLIKGYSNPQLSGYLSMWIPVGASSSQDVRTAPSTKASTDGKALHSNSASDSNVIFEAFSNFMAMPTNPGQAENAVMTKKAGFYKSLGITTMELPPQYRSSEDNSFLDSTVRNGYAFSDRYDLGFGTPTKYGTANQLADAIRALHNQNMSVLADYVPDQLYSLNGKQVVNVSRTDTIGNPDQSSNLQNVLYAASSKSSGTDYQYIYGGEFLDELKKKYPDLFTTKQISTGEPIDPSKKIKQWTAEYLNGSNVQGRGAGYVLSNTFGKDYYTVSGSNNLNVTKDYMPKALYGENVTYGLQKDSNGRTVYVTTGGYIPTNTFLQDDSGNWFYADENGELVNAPSIIDGNKYYFLSNGVNLRDAIVRSSNGSLSYYQGSGVQAVAKGYYYSDVNGKSVFVKDDGTLATGLITNDSNVQYFNDSGMQVKGQLVNINGKLRYFSAGSGNVLTNKFIKYNNNMYYAKNDGVMSTGLTKYKGYKLYFNSDGTQLKNGYAFVNGQAKYFGKTGVMVNKNTRIPKNSVKNLWTSSKGINYINEKISYKHSLSKKLNSLKKQLKKKHSVKLKKSYSEYLSLYNSSELNIKSLNYKKKKVQKFISLNSDVKKTSKDLKNAKSYLTKLKKQLKKHSTKNNKKDYNAQVKVVKKLDKIVTNKVKSLNSIKKKVTQFKL